MLPPSTPQYDVAINFMTSDATYTAKTTLTKNPSNHVTLDTDKTMIVDFTPNESAATMTTNTRGRFGGMRRRPTPTNMETKWTVPDND